MVSFTLFFTLGVWLLQQQAALPDLRWGWLITPLLPALLLPPKATWQRITRTLLLLLLGLTSGFFHAAWMAQQRLSDELPAVWQGRDIELVGVVAEMPRVHERGLSFVLDVEQVITPEAHVPHHLMLSTYANRDDVALNMHAGERWQLTVRLKQPHGSSNPYNFDFEVWALERDLRAVGYVHGKGANLRLDTFVASPAYYIERMRESVRTKFQRVLALSPAPSDETTSQSTRQQSRQVAGYPASGRGEKNYVGVLSALAIGDQGSIPAAQWQVFTRTGVNHLMSISGLHITMLSGMAFALCYWLWRRSAVLTLWLPARKASALAGLLVALAYALISGYGVPAQRTVYMLGTVAAALWLSRNIAPSQLLAAALLVVLLLDPWSVLSAGFWLSFGAVALIFYITANRLGTQHWQQEGDGNAVGHPLASPWRGLIEYGRIQWAMSIGLIPPLLAMFQQISLVSPLANAFAIPLVSFVVVPLTLLGALLPFDWILQLAHWVMSYCMVALEWLSSLSVAVWTQHAPPVWSIVLGIMGVLWILLPRGFPTRWLGAMLLLPMFLVQPESPAPASLHLAIFDVGQGLAVAAQTRHHALLYDSGPEFNSEANSGNRILVPALRGMGIASLDTLMLTHDDSDHTGGALSVMQAMPVTLVQSSLPDDSPILQQGTPSLTLMEPLAIRLDGKAAKSLVIPQRERELIHCSDGQNWDWDGVHFEILHPAPESYGQENISTNNRGCVLRISIGQHSVLLAADIEKDSEQRLLQRHADLLPATLLVVPHHGSKTSSTPAFVNAVQPRYAVFTAGYRNHFGHPKEEVVARYRAAGSELLRSDEDGAIMVKMDAETFSVERYRKTHARYWQQTP